MAPWQSDSQKCVRRVRYVCDMCAINVRYVCDMCAIRVRHVCDMCATCVRYVCDSAYECVCDTYATVSDICRCGFYGCLSKNDSPIELI